MMYNDEWVSKCHVDEKSTVLTVDTIQVQAINLKREMWICCGFAVDFPVDFPVDFNFADRDLYLLIFLYISNVVIKCQIVDE